MIDVAYYLVNREIAIRSGVADKRYRAADGRIILDNKDLSRIRFTSEELISGLNGSQRISESTALRLMAENGYRKGLLSANTVDTPIVQESVAETSTANTTESVVEETTANESVTEETSSTEQSSVTTEEAAGEVNEEGTDEVATKEETTQEKSSGEPSEEPSEEVNEENEETINKEEE